MVSSCHIAQTLDSCTATWRSYRQCDSEKPADYCSHGGCVLVVYVITFVCLFGVCNAQYSEWRMAQIMATEGYGI
eukprot:5730646-Amphidinium_carterae.1